jgi:hypothetical protein
MLADGLIATFGLGSHLLSLGLVAVGIRCFSRRPLSPSVAQVGSTTTGTPTPKVGSL